MTLLFVLALLAVIHPIQGLNDGYYDYNGYDDYDYGVGGLRGGAALIRGPLGGTTYLEEFGGSGIGGYYGGPYGGIGGGVFRGAYYNPYTGVGAVGGIGGVVGRGRIGGIGRLGGIGGVVGSRRFGGMGGIGGIGYPSPYSYYPHDYDNGYNGYDDYDRHRYPGINGGIGNGYHIGGITGFRGYDMYRPSFGIAGGSIGGFRGLDGGGFGGIGGITSGRRGFHRYPYYKKKGRKGVY